MKCNNNGCHNEVHEVTNIINGTYVDDYGAEAETFVLCRDCFWKIVHYLQGCGDHDFVLKEPNHARTK